MGHPVHKEKDKIRYTLFQVGTSDSKSECICHESDWWRVCTVRQEQKGHHVADILKRIFLTKYIRVLIPISVRVVYNGPIDVSTGDGLVPIGRQAITWTSDDPVCYSMHMISLPGLTAFTLWRTELDQNRSDAASIDRVPFLSHCPVTKALGSMSIRHRTMFNQRWSEGLWRRGSGSLMFATTFVYCSCK